MTHLSEILDNLAQFIHYVATRGRAPDAQTSFQKAKI